LKAKKFLESAFIFVGRQSTGGAMRPVRKLGKPANIRGRPTFM